jgi:uncharacterized membrane protein YdjX (TVP38/TMEM64 family)
MADISQWIYDLLSPLGIGGLLLCIFLLFFIDAILFPTIPELFAIIIFSVYPTPWFAVEILATIAVAEVLGLTLLWLIVKNLHIPKKVQDALNRYTKFLIFQDEKIILLNRLAPVLPFMGAFVAVCNWSYKRCLAYTLIGGMIKYGIILALGSIFFSYLESGVATTITIILVLVIIAISIIYSIMRKKKMTRTCEPGSE